jgi:hypothetical protein
VSRQIQVSIDSAGELRIPANQGRDAGLRPGMILNVEEDANGDIRLRPDALERRNGLLVYTGPVIDDISGFIQDERERRLDYLTEGLTE